jgi:hypothetical protein
MPLSELAAQAVVAIGIVILVFYFGGSLLNRAIGERWARYCWRLLQSWSARGGTIRWYGINGFQIELPQLSSPFRSARLTVILQPRNLVWLWLRNRLRGYDELLVFRAALERLPAHDLEIVHRRSQFRGDAAHAARTAGWTITPAWRGPFWLATNAPSAHTLAGNLLHQLGAEERRLRRLALRRQFRELEVHLALLDGDALPPEMLARLLRRLGKAAQAPAAPTEDRPGRAADTPAAGN